jgi:uncharacterized protein YlzI (FlbEa/FlbD family)
MITLHRLGHLDEPFDVNPDLIVTVEAHPDTVLTLATGTKFVVAESGDEVACEGETLEEDDLAYASLYCADENVVVLDGETLVPALNEDIGDFAVASEVAQLWAIAAQSQLGVAEAENAGLQADCLTGAWAAWTFPVDGEPESDVLTMSAGDLDEGIMAFIAYGTGDGGPSVFDRTDALRTGFFGGYEACEEYGSLT